MNDEYYALAKNIAKIIVEESNYDIEDVMLYGSILKKDTPKDIDMLVIHSNDLLQNYTTSRSFCKDNEEDVTYFSSTVLLHSLGNIKNGENTVFHKVSKLFRSAGFNIDKDDPNPDAIDKVLDLHFINTFLFVNYDKKYLQSMSNPEEYRIKRFLAYQANEARQEAVNLSGKDLFFYNKILSSGLIYHPKKHDFTIKFDDKYPGIKDLFPSGPTPS